MSDQFDLEQDIMSCWNITSDLDTLLEEVIEGEPTQDQIANIVLGLSQLYEIKFNKLFRTFESFLKEYYRMRDELKHTQAELREYQDREYSGKGEWREYTEEELRLVEDEESEF